MKKIKFPLFFIAALLCACGDSGNAPSAPSQAYTYPSSSSTTPEMTEPSKDPNNEVTTLEEKYSYIVTMVFGTSECSVERKFMDVTFHFAPSSYVTIISKDVTGSDVLSGFYRTEQKADVLVYNIQVQDEEKGTIDIEYYPHDGMLILLEGGLVAFVEDETYAKSFCAN